MIEKDNFNIKCCMCFNLVSGAGYLPMKFIDFIEKLKQIIRDNNLINPEIYYENLYDGEHELWVRGYVPMTEKEIKKQNKEKEKLKKEQIAQKNATEREELKLLNKLAQKYNKTIMDETLI
jgi:hypothetical protein